MDSHLDRSRPASAGRFRRCSGRGATHCQPAGHVVHLQHLHLVAALQRIHCPHTAPRYAPTMMIFLPFCFMSELPRFVLLRPSESDYVFDRNHAAIRRPQPFTSICMPDRDERSEFCEVL